MSTFVNRTFASGNDMALQLGGEEWVRTLAMGNVWNKIRLGSLMAINPVGTNNLPAGGSPKIGLCSGSTSPYGSAATTNFIGVDLAYSTGVGAYSAGTGGVQPVFNFNGSNDIITKVGSTITPVSLAGGWNSSLPVVGAGTARRFITLLDITKGTPNYSVTFWTIDPPSLGLSTSVDITTVDLLYAMGLSGAITLEGIGVATHTAAIACSEATGGFDTVNVYSSLPGYPLEVYSVAVQKLA